MMCYYLNVHFQGQRVNLIKGVLNPACSGWDPTADSSLSGQCFAQVTSWVYIALSDTAKNEMWKVWKEGDLLCRHLFARTDENH